MFLPFFDALRANHVPVSLREYLAFLEGMSAGLVTYDVDGFYFLARTAMVKDERNLDKFGNPPAHYESEATAQNTSVFAAMNKDVENMAFLISGKKDAVWPAITAALSIRAEATSEGAGRT